MNNYKIKSKDFFNKIGNKKYGNSEKIDKLILRHLKDKGEIMILDIGCGTGRILKKIKIVNSKMTGVGLDISEEVISIATRDKRDGLEFLRGDSENLPFKNNSFDYILCVNSFHHYSETSKVVSEMRRVLKESGKVLFGEIWLPFGLKFIINIYLNAINNYFTFLSKGDYKIYSKKDLKTIFSEEGLKMKSFKIESLVLSFSVYEI